MEKIRINQNQFWMTENSQAEKLILKLAHSFKDFLDKKTNSECCEIKKQWANTYCCKPLDKNKSNSFFLNAGKYKFPNCIKSKKLDCSYNLFNQILNINGTLISICYKPYVDDEPNSILQGGIYFGWIFDSSKKDLPYTFQQIVELCKLRYINQLNWLCPIDLTTKSITVRVYNGTSVSQIKEDVSKIFKGENVEIVRNRIIFKD